MQDSCHELPSCFHLAWEISQERHCYRQGLKEGQKGQGKEEASILKQARQVLPETACKADSTPAPFTISTQSYLQSYSGLQKSLTLSHDLYSFTCGIQV